MKIFFLSLLGVVWVLANGYFVVTEGQQAIITQFGRPIGKEINKAGLHFKLPFVQKVSFVEKRMLSWDGYPNQVPTKDKKYISVDTTARWQIIDTLKFIQTVQNERGAKARLDAILDAATRNVISNHNLVDAVRDTNNILENLSLKRKELAEKKQEGDNNSQEIEEEISGEIEKITTGRERLSAMIAEAADKELTPLGIKLIDVQLRRISYEKGVESKVYERMISERERFAQKIRSIGEGEKAKIEGRLTKDLHQIESEAYRKAQKIKADGEAQVIAIYAKALSKDPEFYELQKTLEAYKTAIQNNTKFILSSNSEFLKFLQQVRN